MHLPEPTNMTVITASDPVVCADHQDRVLRARDVDLRPFRMEDVDQTYQGWLLDEAVVKYLEVAFTDRSLPALRAYMGAAIADPNRFFYLVVDRDKAHRIGTASFAVNTRHRTVNWGYMIGERDYWGTGVSLQVQVALFDLAFDSLGVRRFHGAPYRDHVASRFNLKRLGFKEEGVLRRHYCRGPDGEEVVDLVQYGLLAEEWRAIRHKFDYLRYRSDAD